MIDLFSQTSNWNIILLTLYFASFAGMAIFVERLLFFRRAESDIDRLVIKLRPAVKAGDIVDAIQTCEMAGGSVAAVITEGLLKHHRSQSEIEGAMQLAGQVEMAKLEKNAKLLSIIAHIAPLIGLLGTVLGFIQAFSEMRRSGLVDISATRIGEAMEYALITTAAGLVVAIPATLAYNYLVSRIERFALEMQTTSAQVVDLLLTREDR